MDTSKIVAAIVVLFAALTISGCATLSETVCAQFDVFCEEVVPDE